MNVVFRVDSSACIGTGHLTRCLTLAEALRRRGVQTRFVCRDQSGNSIDEGNYSSWLGVSSSTDAEQTIAALGDERPDWLIVDHYGIDIEWEQRLRPRVEKLMVIDDLGNRRHDCDVLLDQNYSADGERRYAGLTPASCRRLIGPHYALLKPEYAAQHQASSARPAVVKNVLVFFGAANHAARLALEALSLPEFRQLNVDLVVDANTPGREKLEELAAARPRTILHGTLPHLADLMANADLAIGACGATALERMCLGVPSIVVRVAENQRPAGEALAGAGLIVDLGDAEFVRAEHLANAIRELIQSPDRLSALSQRNKLLVDGYGALRVAEILCPTAAEQLALRPANAADMDLYFHWVNETEVRRQSTCSEPIAWSRHQEWFAGKLAGGRTTMLVLVAGGLPVGQIRYDREGDRARIDYSLDVLVRGRGWGVELVRMGNEWIQANGPIALHAEVKAGNMASRAVFARLGFEQAVPAQPDGQYIYFSGERMHA